MPLRVPSPWPDGLCKSTAAWSASCHRAHRRRCARCTVQVHCRLEREPPPPHTPSSLRPMRRSPRHRSCHTRRSRIDPLVRACCHLPLPSNRRLIVPDALPAAHTCHSLRAIDTRVHRHATDMRARRRAIRLSRNHPRAAALAEEAVAPMTAAVTVSTMTIFIYRLNGLT